VGSFKTLQLDNLSMPSLATCRATLTTRCTKSLCENPVLDGR
jgi:hypothetical protein